MDRTPPDDRARDKAERLAAALRANLKRRKAPPPAEPPKDA